MKLSDLPLDQEALIRKLLAPRYSPATTNKRQDKPLHAVYRDDIATRKTAEAWDALIALAQKVLEEESKG